MYAAPTTQEDFEILIGFQKKMWKDKIAYLDTLIDELDKNLHPQKLEICFLEMLKNTNVNIIRKTIKLIHKYILLYGIRNLSLKQLASCILNSSLVDVDVEEVVKDLFMSTKKQKEKELIMQAMKNFCDGSREKINIMTIQIYCELMQSVSLKELCYFQYFEESLSQTMYNLTEETENVLKDFFKHLFQNIGYSAILFLRKVGYPHTLKIIQEFQEDHKEKSLKIHLNGDHFQSTHFGYIYTLNSENWLEDYHFIPIKCINISLKNAEKQIEEGGISISLTEELIESFTCLAKRKNNTVNKSIYEIIAKILNREFFNRNISKLFGLLYQLLSNKRIGKKILEENKTAKEKMWLNTVTRENLEMKIEESSVQEEYHRLIILLEFLKKGNSESIKDKAENLKQKPNISSVYWVQLDHLSKENTEQN